MLNKRILLLFSVIIIILLSIYFYLHKTSFITDEYSHFLTITEIAQDRINEKTFSRNAQIPGYYYFMSIFSRIKTDINLNNFRFIQTILSIFTIIIFYKTANLINPKHSKIKTLQFILLPIFSIFLVLLYNESFSLLFLLLSLYFLIKKKYSLSWLTSIFCVLIRQNNIIWIGFIAFYHFFNTYNFPITKIKILNFLTDAYGYLFSLITIFVFLIQNGEPAMADAEANPLAIHIENPIFFLFLFVLLFLPIIIVNFRSIIKFTKKNPWIFLIILILFPIFFYLFKADNWFNNPAFNFYIRNKFINTVISSSTNKIIFFLFSSLSLLAIPILKLEKKEFNLFYLFSILYLSLSWLIECRYHIIPFTLFILFRKPEGKLPEIILIIYFLLMNIWLIWGSANMKFFI